jgi:hypothetical protein
MARFIDMFRSLLLDKKQWSPIPLTLRTLYHADTNNIDLGARLIY